ncbi:hypothetical protein M0R45_036879 [Rubus argutus]|uniref:Pentatricopeptide repeat-containing protein n=1 Tax=Rubus argutus TaxID=59490 RepID=A0AAW1W024_RUBAR
MEVYLLRSTVSSLTLYPDHTHTPNPPIHCLRQSKRSSGPSPKKKDLSRILRTDAAVKNIERKANSNKYSNLWPKAVLEALDGAIANNLWETALKIFGLLRKQHWYEARCQTYTKLLVMLGKCRQPEQARLLFELMLTDGLKPTVDVYTALVGVYGKSGLLDKAFSTVDYMKSVSDCKPDVYTYSILINCCTKFRRYDLIEQILAEMSYLGIGCNTVIFNTLIDGYGKAEMFELMEDSLTNMIESGSCLPDVFTFNSFPWRLWESGQIDKMEKCAYGRAGDINKMGELFLVMEEKKCVPDHITFATMIQACNAQGMTAAAEDLKNRMITTDENLGRRLIGC